MYSATMSRIFSTRSGSGDTLNSSWRHGLSPNARQISLTVVWEIPCLAASPRVDQCVASGGAVSSVSTTIASTTSSPIVRAAPGRGASTSPSSRSAAKRCRHLDTVTGLQPSSAAISAWIRVPSAHANTIRHRNAKACDELCRRAQRCSVLRSSPVRVISTVGRPRRAMVSLRCWSTTPDERGMTAKIPDQPRFLGGTTFRDTRPSVTLAPSSTSSTALCLFHQSQLHERDGGASFAARARVKRNEEGWDRRLGGPSGQAAL
jgi:hypothetical protein